MGAGCGCGRRLVRLFHGRSGLTLASALAVGVTFTAAPTTAEARISTDAAVGIWLGSFALGTALASAASYPYYSGYPGIWVMDTGTGLPGLFLSRLCAAIWRVLRQLIWAVLRIRLGLLTRPQGLETLAGGGQHS